MTSNQKGFSVVEILVVIAIIGLLVTVGWFVYGRQQNKTNNKSTAQISSENKQDTVTKACSGGSSYSDGNVTAVYCPKGWEATATTYPNDDNSHIYGLRISSPDYVQNTELGQEQKGQQLEISVMKNSVDTQANILATNKEAETTFGGNYSETTTVDGLEVAATNHHSEGHMISASGLKEGKMYLFRLITPEDEKQSNIDLFKKFLVSIDLK